MQKKIFIWSLSLLLLSGCASNISILSKEYTETKPTIAKEIMELKKLLEEGVITKEEFEKKKSELLISGEDREEKVKKIEAKEKSIK